MENKKVFEREYKATFVSEEEVNQVIKNRLDKIKKNTKLTIQEIDALRLAVDIAILTHGMLLRKYYGKKDIPLIVKEIFDGIEKHHKIHKTGFMATAINTIEKLTTVENPYLPEEYRMQIRKYLKGDKNGNRHS